MVSAAQTRIGNRPRIGRWPGRPALGLVAASALAIGIAHPAVAQSGAQTTADTRVRQLEAQVRALQRKVFPGGAGQTFPPEITAPANDAPIAAATTSAVTDLLTRMDAIEAQLARITASNEQNTNRIAQIEARLAPSGTSPAGTAPAASGPPATGAPTVGPVDPDRTPLPPSTGANTVPPATGPSATGPSATGPSATGPSATGPSASGPSASRVEAVRAVEKPQTADAGDDEYSYGYRLWDAKFYPEAEQQLRTYLQKYPKHPRVSYARNLLGRAYLADNDPREAAKWFLQNYQADKAGARAPDSLLYLGRSMKQLGDTKRACIALSEFGSSYAAEASGRLKGDYDDTRSGLTCG